MNKKVTIIEPEEDQTYRIYPVYRRKCDNMGMQVLPYIKQFLELATEIGGFKTVNILLNIVKNRLVTWRYAYSSLILSNS